MSKTIQFANLLQTVERTFRHEAENRKLTFETELDSRISAAV